MTPGGQIVACLPIAALPSTTVIATITIADGQPHVQDITFGGYAEFEQLKAELPNIKTEAEDKQQELKETAYDIADALSDARRAHRAKKDELFSLQTARTLIPKREVARRLTIAQGAGVPAADLPYVAELIEIASGEERWLPAAERVLRNYGLRMLVPDKHAAPVKRFIDQNNMAGIIEYSVVTAVSDHQPAPLPNTLASKIVVDETHPHRSWLTAQIAQRFDHVCVETADELDGHPLAVTVGGTVKLRGSHYRKDDREEVVNPSSYILGVNTVAKREALESEVRQLRQEEKIATEAADEHQRQLRATETAVTTVRDLDAYPHWVVIDQWETTRRARDLEQRIEAIRNDSEDLQQLEKDRIEAQKRYRRAEETCAGITSEMEKLTTRRPRLIDLQDELDNKPHTVDDEHDLEFLNDALANAAVNPDAENFDPTEQALRKEIRSLHEAAENERRLAHTRLEIAIKSFIEQWRDAAPDTSGDVDRSGADFVTLYEEISQRSLPSAMSKFQRLIADDMVPSIGFLQREIENAATEIRKRITMVNEGLSKVEFNPGTRLQIAHKPLPADEAGQFRDAVDTLLKHAPAAKGNAEESRKQFKRVRQLMARFTTDTTEAKQWKNNVLDVRNTIAFYGREERIDDRTTIATFSNTSTNSGGEQEKLVAFCLAAALSYNLADNTSGGVPHFAPLMLDEAFSKSDETFAGQALGVFHEFGFQLLIAAPIRMAGIVEPFIGQAVLVEKRQLADGPHSNAATATFGQLAARRDED